MPDTNATHVLTTAAVRWSIEELGAQRLHPTFVVYLYLRAQARAGKLAEASAGSSELAALIEMPGHPTKPFYFPLIDRGKRTGGPLPTFWRADNISGSWSPGSIRRLNAGAWLGGAQSDYVMPEDHAQRALTGMLYNQPVNALAMAAYFLRNDGFVLSGAPDSDDLVTAFRAKFDYPSDAEDEFSTLFVVKEPQGASFPWFQLFPPPLHHEQGDQEEAANV